MLRCSQWTRYRTQTPSYHYTRKYAVYPLLTNRIASLPTSARRWYTEPPKEGEAAAPAVDINKELVTATEGLIESLKILNKYKRDEATYQDDIEAKHDSIMYRYKGEDRDEICREMLKIQTEHWDEDFILKESVKDEIYFRYNEDRVVNHPKVLCIEYDLPFAYVCALLCVKRVEEWYVQSGKQLDSRVVRAKEQYFPHLVGERIHGFGVKANLPREQDFDGKIPGYHLLEPEVDYKKYIKNIPQRFKVYLRPAETPPHPEDEDTVQIIRPPILSSEETKRLRVKLGIPEPYGRVFFLDTDRRRRLKTRLWVTDIDGTIRTATWEERKTYYGTKRLQKRVTPSWLHKLDQLWHPVIGPQILDKIVASFAIPSKQNVRREKQRALCKKQEQELTAKIEELKAAGAEYPPDQDLEKKVGKERWIERKHERRAIRRKRNAIRERNEERKALKASIERIPEFEDED